MTTHFCKIIHISYTPTYRLRLSDGGYVFMPFHRYCGVMGFYKDKSERREILDWWDNPLICEALNWFCRRGNKA